MRYFRLGPNRIGKNVISAFSLTISVGLKGALIGGVVGYVVGLFFKSLIIVLITLKVPSFDQYLVSTFIPAGGLATPDFLRFFTVPLPFALMGAAVGALAFRSRTAGIASMPEF